MVSPQKILRRYLFDVDEMLSSNPPLEERDKLRLQRLRFVSAIWVIDEEESLAKTRRRAIILTSETEDKLRVKARDRLVKIKRLRITIERQKQKIKELKGQ